jgi:hypothetical protein
MHEVTTKFILAAMAEHHALRLLALKDEVAKFVDPPGPTMKLLDSVSVPIRRSLPDLATSALPVPFPPTIFINLVGDPVPLS